MHYSRLSWNHASLAEPAEILSEYDAQGWECRKVEIYPDGSLGFADSSHSFGMAKLSLIPRPADDEVVGHEFKVSDLTREEFEEAWNQAHRALAANPSRAVV